MGGVRGGAPLLGVLLAACAPALATPAIEPAPARAPASRAALVAAIDSMTADARFRNAQWGILVVDPERGDTLYARNADKLFMPASNMKLVTGAIVLARVGPAFRYRTVVLGRGPITPAGVLDGDLLVIGDGDPSMSGRFHTDTLGALLALADSLIARGVRRIGGRLIGSGDAFPDENHGFGWSWNDLAEAYGAGVDELMVAEGAARLTIRGGARTGDSTTISVSPDIGYPTLWNQLRTTADSAVVGRGVRVVRDSAAGVVIVRGAVPPGSSTTLDVAYSDQAAAFFAALRTTLLRRGIVVDGREPREPGGRVDTLFVLESPPLSELLPAMMKPSQNQLAEVMFKTIARSATGVGTFDSARTIVSATLREWGADPDAFVVRDGSGLSRYNYLTPRTIVRVLDRMRQDSVFRASLPAAGREGTLATRMRGTPAEGVVRAKTGFLTAARSLSGYAPTADGKLLLFSLLGNNWTVPVREVEAVQDAIVQRLVLLRLDAP